jgi:hypothetical protein
VSEAKSTMSNFNGIEEFNSYWLVRNRTLSATVKFMYAALKPKVTSVMEDRLRTFAELRKQLIENDGGFCLCGVVMINQMLIHYRMLGSRGSVMFKKYSDLINKIDHPCFGFFPYENFMCPGLCGYQHSLHYLTKNSNNCKRATKFIYGQKGTTITEEGKPSIKISLLIGSRERFKRFLSKLGNCYGYELIAEKHPYFLLKGSETVLQSLFNIYKKAKTPSSAEAFFSSSIKNACSWNIYFGQGLSNFQNKDRQNMGR